MRVVPDARRELPRLRRAAPDLVVSWFWTKKLPREVLELAPRRPLGVHPSLLPRHRGPDPFFHAIDAGDAETGVTVHELEEAYDTGRVLAQERLTIGARDAWALARALDRPSLRQLRRVMGALARGERVEAAPQDEAEATWAGAPTDDDLELRWTWPAERLVRRIRAAAPWPGAYTELGGRVLVVTRAEATDDVPRALAPGEAAVRADGAAVVRAGRGGVVLLGGRFEDDGDEVALGPEALARLVTNG